MTAITGGDDVAVNDGVHVNRVNISSSGYNIINSTANAGSLAISVEAASLSHTVGTTNLTNVPDIVAIRSAVRPVTLNNVNMASVRGDGIVVAVDGGVTVTNSVIGTSTAGAVNSAITAPGVVTVVGSRIFVQADGVGTERWAISSGDNVYFGNDTKTDSTYLEVRVPNNVPAATAVGGLRAGGAGTIRVLSSPTRHARVSVLSGSGVAVATTGDSIVIRGGSQSTAVVSAVNGEALRIDGNGKITVIDADIRSSVNRAEDQRAAVLIGGNGGIAVGEIFRTTSVTASGANSVALKTTNGSVTVAGGSINGGFAAIDAVSTSNPVTVGACAPDCNGITGLTLNVRPTIIASDSTTIRAGGNVTVNNANARIILRNTASTVRMDEHAAIVSVSGAVVNVSTPPSGGAIRVTAVDSIVSRGRGRALMSGTVNLADASIVVNGGVVRSAAGTAIFNGGNVTIVGAGARVETGASDAGFGAVDVVNDGAVEVVVGNGATVSATMGGGGLSPFVRTRVTPARKSKLTVLLHWFRR
jgi:hypothetical protein